MKKCSNNASRDLDVYQVPDNPQEMLNIKNFYFSGLIAAEMSCSIIKAKNKNPQGYYYTIDFTVTNADKKLLQKVNTAVMNNRGILTVVKGGYNLSARGKSKVKNVLDFLVTYPILIGDLAKNRINILCEAYLFLIESKDQQKKIEMMENLRQELRGIKTKGVVKQTFDLQSISRDTIGYFLSGVIDGEGSIGFKLSNKTKQPFFAIAMKDKKIIETLRNFIGYGNIRLRKDGVYHLEINCADILRNVCVIFLEQYPLQHSRQRERLQRLQQLLNDHTPRSLHDTCREHDMV